MKWTDLTAAQQVAVIDLVGRKTLYRERTGWPGSGCTHAHRTIQALQRRGLATMHSTCLCPGWAKPTRTARTLIKNEFGHPPPLVAVTIAKKRGQR
jgi:hypothetical protein